MADILLAECGDGVWLVGGEAYLDDLLANTLPPDVSIELVTCERPADVRALWAQHGGDAAAGMPWMVHPAIVARVKGTLQDAAPEAVVRFGPWSALLDEAALAVIATAAARVTGGANITLVEWLDPAVPPAVAALSGLRLQLIEDQFATHGVPRDRISRERRDAGAAPDSDRVDIVVH
jgi:hypothetical protein